MKRNLQSIVGLSAFIFICALLISIPAYSAPDFPPRDNGTIQRATPEQTGDQPALPKENMTPESAKSNKIAELALAEVHVTVLFGKNQDGEKSYKVDQKVVEVQNSDDSQKDPTVKVTYKDKSDKNQYVVSEVFVKKNKDGTYKVTAKIDELKDGEEKTDPKITYLD